MDATANIYLAIGSLIAAGIDGLARGACLPEPLNCDPRGLAQDKRPPQLLSSLHDAVIRFEKSAWVAQTFSAGVTKALVAIRKVRVWLRSKSNKPS